MPITCKNQNNIKNLFFSTIFSESGDLILFLATQMKSFRALKHLINAFKIQVHVYD